MTEIKLNSTTSKSNNNNKLAQNLAQLQNLIKRDPSSYVDEFQRHCIIYKATYDVFMQNPSVFNRQFYDIVLFLAQVAHCFKNSKELESFPSELMGLLRGHASILHPNQRQGLVRALLLLRNKELIEPRHTIVLFFELMRCPDKALRTFLETSIITDIQNLNKKGKNNRINREIQNFMHQILADNHAVAAKTALEILIRLYKKRIWNDEKTANLVAEAIFSKISKVSVTAIRFFVGTDEDNDGGNGDSSDSDSDEEGSQPAKPNLRVALMAQRVGKKTRKKQRQTEKVKALVKKNRKKEKTKKSFDFSALHLIRDPQAVAERLYAKLEKTNLCFQVKLMMMNLISRLMGVHRLYLGNFYPLIQRYLFPHQEGVTKIMTYAAQAAHQDLPPEELTSTLRTLADNFVTETCHSEAMAMGINAIRELCVRNHHCMDADLLEDLAQYKSHRDRAVSMAARGLVAVFRLKNPTLLRRRDRGAPDELSVETRTKEFGESEAIGHVPGAEIVNFAGEDGYQSDVEESSDESESESDSDDDTPKDQKSAINKVLSLRPEERKTIAEDITSTRLLTDADFDRIDAAQAAKRTEIYAERKKGKKRKEMDSFNDLREEKEIVSEKSIVMIYKKRRHDKEARLETVMAGREGREKYGAKTGRMNPFASTTNKEKKKTKNFMMLKHKVRRKMKSHSFQDKQMRLKESLLKQKRKIIK